MLIDCDTCGIRDTGCAGCLVTALLDTGSPVAALGPAEHRAIEVFARAGFEVEVLPAPLSRDRAVRPGPRRVVDAARAMSRLRPGA